MQAPNRPSRPQRTGKQSLLTADNCISGLSSFCRQNSKQQNSTYTGITPKSNENSELKKEKKAQQKDGNGSKLTNDAKPEMQLLAVNSDSFPVHRSLGRRMHHTNFNSLYIVIPVYLRDSSFKFHVESSGEPEVVCKTWCTVASLLLRGKDSLCICCNLYFYDIPM